MKLQNVLNCKCFHEDQKAPRAMCVETCYLNISNKETYNVTYNGKRKTYQCKPVSPLFRFPTSLSFSKWRFSIWNKNELNQLSANLNCNTAIPNAGDCGHLCSRFKATLCKQCKIILSSLFTFTAHKHYQKYSTDNKKRQLHLRTIQGKTSSFKRAYFINNNIAIACKGTIYNVIISLWQCCCHQSKWGTWCFVPWITKRHRIDVLYSVHDGFSLGHTDSEINVGRRVCYG